MWVTLCQDTLVPDGKALSQSRSLGSYFGRHAPYCSTENSYADNCKFIGISIFCHYSSHVHVVMPILFAFLGSHMAVGNELCSIHIIHVMSLSLFVFCIH